MISRMEVKLEIHDKPGVTKVSVLLGLLDTMENILKFTKTNSMSQEVQLNLNFSLINSVGTPHCNNLSDTRNHG